ncbi:MAG: glycosyltransferase [Phycisphaeraceae bacterium]|nr:glycosyltransferase [Phycisphaeraceae bacterium]
MPTAQVMFRWTLTGLYFAILGAVCIYGLHRYWMVWLFWRHYRHPHRPMGRFTDLPGVTVQLPMFNEPAVARRAIDAACRLDYPADRLQIQVLDDSTDGSDVENRQICRAWSERGIHIEHVHRANRQGYKAGALAEAMPAAAGELIAIFDADFVPTPNFLKRTVHHFTNPRVGMVQTRWTHLNRDDSLLTRSQAIFLDGHFMIEHTARNRASRWINFNGTAGIWRKAAIEAAGGWQADTLTEDVDLSYRAQLAGWDFVFLPHVQCPAELPPEIMAFKSQQHRWTKGSIQTAIKLLPTILRAKAPAAVKVEAFFHLTSPIVYLLITLLALLFLPVMLVNAEGLGGDWGWWGVGLGLGLFWLGTVSASVFYVASQRAQGLGFWRTLTLIPWLMGIGIGIAVNNARGCVEALVGHRSAFVRTPKYNCQAGGSRSATPGSRRLQLSRAGVFELVMGCYMLVCAVWATDVRHTIVSVPFVLMFAGGYFYVGLTSLHSRWASQAATPTAAVAAA